MKRNVLIVFVLAFSLISSWGQGYPRAVLPGQKITVAPKKDTLWVITDNQLERALITAKELDNANKQIVNYQEQVENLNEQLEQTDTLLMQTQKNMELYRKDWRECSDNIKVLVKENDMLNTKFKIAKLVGIVSTIAAFALGAYLF